MSPCHRTPSGTKYCSINQEPTTTTRADGVVPTAIRQQGLWKQDECKQASLAGPSLNYALCAAHHTHTELIGLCVLDNNYRA